MSTIGEMIRDMCPDGVEYRLLGDIAEYSTDRVDSAVLDNTTFVGVDNLLADKSGRVDSTYLANTSVVTGYMPGDVLLGNIRPYLKKVWLADRSGGCSGDVLAVRLRPEFQSVILPGYLYFVLSSDAFFRHYQNTARGAKMPRGDKTAVMGYSFQVPPLAIQRELVRVLDQFTQLEAELEAELEARRRQYEYYRDRLLTFPEKR